jgi:EAL domain-containing protein (putative c-di-GMP-specific phosphodiesterase class I)
MLDDRAMGASIIDRLAAAGVRMWLDDFGTGYSSLMQLRSLSFAGIKIDRSFVGQMHRNHDDAIIVESTIALARRLGLSVVAEGVEDEATLQRLAAMGCEFVQGYHLGRPMPFSALVECQHLQAIPTVGTR